jgi:hypothetical protein
LPSSAILMTLKNLSAAPYMLTYADVCMTYASSMTCMTEQASTYPTTLHAQSFTRQLLLKEMGVEYHCEPADIDEKAIRHDDPQVMSIHIYL